MTNYNERLDKILMAYKRYPYGTSAAPHISGDEAKQAIASLTKEMVAEAKPEKRIPDYYSDSIDLYSRQCAANSWNKAIDQFEHNLLKELEEV